MVFGRTVGILSLLFVVISLCSGQSGGDLRLWRDGSSSPNYTYGRLQIFVGGKWGEVCDEGFGKNEADVACHQLQYVSAVAEGSGEIESDESNLSGISLSDVYCPTNDYLHLLRCSAQLGQHSCSNGKGYTMLECVSSRIWSNPYFGQLRLAHSNYSSQGLVKVYCARGWGNICAGSTFGKTEADTVCRQLGYTESANYNHLSLSDYDPVILTDVDCPTSNEECLAPCRHCSQPVDEDSCYYSRVTVECKFDLLHYSFGSNVSTCEYTEGGFFPPRPRVGEIRLTTTTDSTTGVPELYYTPSFNDTWSQICVPSTGPGNQDVADTICVQLGYTGGGAKDYTLSDSSSGTMFVSASCSEKYPHLFWCDLESVQNCLVFTTISCYENDTYYTGQLRLRDGEYPSEGRVEIYVYGVWSSIRYSHYYYYYDYYYYNEDYDTVNSICRQLGYTGAVYFEQGVIQGSGPVHISTPSCSYERPCFSQCLYSSDFVESGTSSHYYDLSVNCTFNRTVAASITIGSQSECTISEPPTEGPDRGWIAAAVIVPLLVCLICTFVCMLVCCVVGFTRRANRKSRQRTYASGPVSYTSQAPGGGAVYMIPANNIPPQGILLVPPTQGGGQQAQPQTQNETADEEKVPLPLSEEVSPDPTHNLS